MSSDVFARHATGETYFGFIHSCVSHSSFSSRTPCPSCPPSKNFTGRNIRSRSVAILAQAILAQAISCSNVRCVFPVHESFWFCFLQVSTAQFCSFPPFLMVRASDGTDVPDSPLPAPLRLLVLLMVLFLTLKDRIPRQYDGGENQRNVHTNCRYSCSAYPDSKIASRRFPRQWPRMLRKSRKLNKWLAALQPVLPHWKRMQRPSPVDSARRDLGIDSDIVTAPQPLGPMAQGHLMTFEIQDEDLIRSQAPKMNKHEVPFYYGSLANKITKGLRSGSILFGMNPICQPTVDLLQFIAKQVLCRSGLYLKHEPNVKTLLLEKR